MTSETKILMPHRDFGPVWVSLTHPHWDPELGQWRQQISDRKSVPVSDDVVARLMPDGTSTRIGDGCATVYTDPRDLPRRIKLPAVIGAPLIVAALLVWLPIELLGRLWDYLTGDQPT